MLTDEAVINGAIDTMVARCQLMMDDYEAGKGEYRILSVRELIRSLGYNSTQEEDILQTVFERGFTYCLDPNYHTGQHKRVSVGVCCYGADQLESRLQSCRR